MKLQAYYVTRWHQDTHSYGSYSTLRPGQTKSSMHTLGQPLRNKVWFVGEHCHGSKFSFAHGAFESGERAASAVAAQLRSKSQQASL